MSFDLAAIYENYIARLNARDWRALDAFVHADVVHNGRCLGVDGYRRMLEANCRDIPDLRFSIELLLVDAPRLACRLAFDCTPSGEFLGLALNGARIVFAEHAIYAFEEDKIREVWSVIDKAAIEAQLRR